MELLKQRSCPYFQWMTRVEAIRLRSAIENTGDSWVLPEDRFKLFPGWDRTGQCFADLEERLGVEPMLVNPDSPPYSARGCTGGVDPSQACPDFRRYILEDHKFPPPSQSVYPEWNDEVMAERKLAAISACGQQIGKIMGAWAQGRSYVEMVGEEGVEAEMREIREIAFSVEEVPSTRVAKPVETAETVYVPSPLVQKAMWEHSGANTDLLSKETRARVSPREMENWGVPVHLRRAHA